MQNSQPIKVYKFGGASVKDAAAILNLCHIVKEHSGNGPLVVVVSAMGKTTNALEEIYDLAYHGRDYSGQLTALEAYHQKAHQELCQRLPQYAQEFNNEDSPVNTFEELRLELARIPANSNYDEWYDQIVSYGETISAHIVADALASFELSRTVLWAPASHMIQTNETWREGGLDWVATEQEVTKMATDLLDNSDTIIVTEGFVGGTASGHTTTLGREGSDYTAAILAYCLRAESVTIWKDVAGLLNADPKIFEDTVRYPEISYQETIEMAYYGASVIHPKTIKPLAVRQIPLYVKSFLDPTAEGTKIHDCRHGLLAPAFIRKVNQCLISFESKDFAFISEENLEVIFGALAQARLKINLMQNSAISFSVCTDFSAYRLDKLLAALREQFTIHYNTELELYTIKNYDAASIQQLTQHRELLLEQRTRQTFQFVCRQSA